MSVIWKYTAGALGIVALVAIVLALMFRGSAASADLRAAKATTEAKSLKGEVASLKEAAGRDLVSNTTTNTARQAAAERQPQQQERAQRVEKLARERIVEVPADCPSPDPDLMRELKDGAGRVHSAEDRLRRVRAPDSEVSR